MRGNFLWVVVVGAAIVFGGCTKKNADVANLGSIPNLLNPADTKPEIKPANTSAPVLTQSALLPSPAVKKEETVKSSHIAKRHGKRHHHKRAHHSKRHHRRHR